MHGISHGSFLKEALFSILISLESIKFSGDAAQCPSLKHLSKLRPDMAVILNSGKLLRCALVSLVRFGVS